MSALVKKEIRLLLPVWIGAVALAVVSTWLLHGNSEARAIPTALSFIVLAAASYGREFGCGTFPLLLSQPATRRRIWGVKSAVLAAALAGLALAIFVGQKLVHTEPFRWNGTAFLFLFSAVTGGFCAALFVRQTFAAFWLAWLIPMAIYVLFLLAGLCLRIDPDHTLDLAWLPLAAYGGLTAWWSWRLYARAQDLPPLGEKSINLAWPTLPRRLRRVNGLRRRAPLDALLAKEFRLHLPGFAAIGGLFLVHLGFLAWLRSPHNLAKETWYTLHEAADDLWVAWLPIPVLFGSIGITEERRIGTIESQFCLPSSRMFGFVVKLTFAVIFGGLIPAMLFHWLAPAQVTPYFKAELFNMCRIFMPLAFAGFFASTLVRQTASAFLLGSCFFLLLNAVIFWGFGHPKITIGGHLFWEGVLGPQLMIALMFVILPWLAWRNYCDTRGVIENCRRTFVVSYISLFVAPTLLAPAIYHRLWEFVTPAAAHGAARLSQNQAPTIDGADELVLTFADGRLWRGGLDFSKSEDSRVPVGILGQGFEEGSNWVKAVGSLYAICALRNDGTLWFARGGDFLKPYPDDQPIRTYEPLLHSDREDDWSDILLLDTTPFLLKRDGSLWIGGSTDVTHWTGTLKFELRRLETASEWKRLFMVAGEPCVEKTDGVTWSLERWWENRGDKYGNVQLRPAFRISPHPLLAGLDVSRWRSLDFGGQTAEGIRDDGTFWSWGKVSDASLNAVA
jgi:hypothetical protein